MDKSFSRLNQTVRQQFVRMLFLLFIVFSIIVIAFFLYVKSNNDRLSEAREEISEKAQLVDAMEESFNNIFFRARGYYAFKSTDELQLLQTELKQFELHVKTFEKMELTNEEQVLSDDLTSFLINYKENILPGAIAAVEADDYEALRDISNGGANALINEFLAYTKAYEQQTDTELASIFYELMDEARFYSVLFILLGLVVLLLIGIITRMVIVKIIGPVEKLTAATNAFATGRDVHIQPLMDKTDELGTLATAFYEMTLSIQDKEEELTTQNEELMAQQDELQDNQLQLQTSLNRLEKVNELNHVLTFTLDKKQLLHNFHTYVRQVYRFDQSLMYLVSGAEYDAKGLAEASVVRLMSDLEDDKRVRLLEEKSFVVKREVLPQQQNIAQQPYFMYDLYSAIFNKEREIIAIMMATREGYPFTAQEMTDINGLMNQASIAFERIFMYEQVERARQLNQHIIDTVNEGIQYVSKQGEVIVVNTALAQIAKSQAKSSYEYVPQQAWLRHFQQLVDEPDELIYFFKHAIVEHFTEPRTIRYSIEGATFVEVYASSIFEGTEKVGTMFVHRDITREYEVDQMKSELVSTVSHELRTPLSSVLGFTELLLTKELKPERQRKYIETIHKEAKRLTNLINDFLDLQRMESGRQTYAMKKLVLSELVADVVKNFDHEQKHPLRIINRAQQAEVLGDGERLMQLIINVIGNAIKFSPQGGDITITLENAAQQVVVHIADQGIGIPKDELPQLFQKFKRIDNSSRRKIGGTGLGLALCKEIVTKHSGQIAIDSVEGEGTTVTFSLPLYVDEQKHRVAQNTVQKNQQGQNVMIVEDDLSLALLLSEELKSNGFSVIYHNDPKRAFEEAQHTPFVCIVVDLMLGDQVRGWDLVERLRASARTEHIPIIISSALDEVPEKVAQYNIEKYFTKPYHPEQLSKLILTL